MKKELTEEEQFKLDEAEWALQDKKKEEEDAYRQKYFERSSKLFNRFLERHNQTDVLLPFIEYHLKYHEKIALKEISEEEIIKHVFPDLSYGSESKEKLKLFTEYMHEFLEAKYYIDKYGDLDEYHLEKLGPKPPQIIVEIMF